MSKKKILIIQNKIMTAKTFFRIDHGCACMRGETALILRLRKKGCQCEFNLDGSGAKFDIF